LVYGDFGAGEGWGDGEGDGLRGEEGRGEGMTE